MNQSKEAGIRYAENIKQNIANPEEDVGCR
jgi:hypothetical protein